MASEGTICAKSAFDGLAGLIALRYRRAFAHRTARRAFRGHQARIASEDFERALCEHNACMELSWRNAATDDDVCICSLCSERVYGIRVVDGVGGHLRWGCAPLATQERVIKSRHARDDIFSRRYSRYNGCKRDAWKRYTLGGQGSISKTAHRCSRWGPVRTGGARSHKPHVPRHANTEIRKSGV